MTESGTTERGGMAEDIAGAANEPTVPPRASARLAAVGIQLLTAKLVQRSSLAGTAALVAVGLSAVLVRRWRGPLKAGG